jgi:hypothetical protein
MDDDDDDCTVDDCTVDVCTIDVDVDDASNCFISFTARNH